MAIVLGLFAAPVLVTLLLRINATMVFLGLCLGYVLMQFLGADTQDFAATFLPHAAVSSNVLKVTLLLFPAVFTAVFMIRTARGAKAVFNLLPALATGCLVVLLVVPLLSPGLSHAITGMSLWRQVARLQGLVVGTGALVSLLFLWMLRPHQDKPRGKHE